MSKNDNELALTRMRAHLDWFAFRELMESHPMLLQAVQEAIEEGASPDDAARLVLSEMGDSSLADQVLRAGRHIASKPERTPVEGE